MLEQFRNHIENAPWEHKVRTAERLLNRVTWVILILAALYFAPVILNILLR